MAGPAPGRVSFFRRPGRHPFPVTARVGAFPRPVSKRARKGGLKIHEVLYSLYFFCNQPHAPVAEIQQAFPGPGLYFVEISCCFSLARKLYNDMQGMYAYVLQQAVIHVIFVAHGKRA